MTLRRYTPIKASRGTVIPPKVRAEVQARDHGCVMARLALWVPCAGQLELDHVRASGGIGMKSESAPENLVTLCSAHHRIKTLEGRKWRPKLLAYLAGVATVEAK